MPEQPEDRELLGEEPDPDALAAEQAQAAAAEAGAIGGPDPQPGLDPTERPVAEGGGGEAEGFEQAEEALAGQASHDDVPADPSGAAFATEPEGDLSQATYGEGDELDVTEVTSDPDAGAEDPGEGPGITAGR